MKICVNCEFKENKVMDTPHGLQSMFVCNHPECSDPVIGEPIPCNIARTNENFCGMKAKYYQKAEEKEPAPLIQLVKSDRPE